MNRVTAVLTLILLGSLLLGTPLLGLQAALASEHGSALEVGESQRYCASAKQCTLVYTRCDSCECGVAVNESFAAAHNRNLEALCASYDGGHCDKVCPIAKPMCVLGLCIMQPNTSL